MGTRLADMTPHKLTLDSAFMAKLRGHLNWKGIQDPPLSALHPSLGNFDHTRRIIETERDKYFPDGTGLDGELTCIPFVRLQAINIVSFYVR